MRALVRQIPASFRQATRAHFGGGEIDVQVARAQHAAYCEALGASGVGVVHLPPLDALPDSCFVEDMAVVAGGTALVTHSGHSGRLGERATVAEALRQWMPVVVMPDGANLDGGDVLVCGDQILVGLTHRTDSAGVAFLRSVFRPLGFRVLGVPVPGLHLKCVASRLGPGVIAATEGSLPGWVRQLFTVLALPVEEAYAANFVVVGRHALVSSGFPGTAAFLRAHGLRTHEVPSGEFRKADGSLTCLSVIF